MDDEKRKEEINDLHLGLLHIINDAISEFVLEQAELIIRYDLTYHEFMFEFLPNYLSYWFGENLVCILNREELIDKILQEIKEKTLLFFKIAAKSAH